MNDHQLNFNIRREDAVSFLRSLRSGSIDLVVTDPAYESLEKHRAIGTTTRLKNSKSSSNAWFTIFPNKRFEELFREVYRVLRMNSHFYMFCDQETMFVAKPIAESVGFRFWPPIIWDKVSIGMGYHYRARYEVILFFEKGKREVSDHAMSDIIKAKRVYKGYPTEKPVGAIVPLIEQSSRAGDIVVDPFSGSGSTGVAALSVGRYYIGCDISQEAVEISTKRLEVAGGIFDTGYNV